MLIQKAERKFIGSAMCMDGAGTKRTRFGSEEPYHLVAVEVKAVALGLTYVIGTTFLYRREMGLSGHTQQGDELVTDEAAVKAEK